LLANAKRKDIYVKILFKELYMSNMPKKLHSFLLSPFIKAAAFLACFVLSSPAFAQNDAIAKMEAVSDKILGLFTGTLVRTILAIAFCCSAVAYAMNKDNQKVQRGALAVGIASVMIIAASGIVSFMMS
jgi:glycerol uptake facilitator-like aquaporin